MTAYMHATAVHNATGDWFGTIPELHLEARASSRARLEHEMYRLVEESYGMKSFTIVWSD